MTGYGKISQEITGKKINIQVKTLNSKQLDLSLRIPHIYRDKELEIRNAIASKLERGKIDFSLDIEKQGTVNGVVINKELAAHYYNELQAIENLLQIPQSTNPLALIMNMPNVVGFQSEELDNEEWNTIKQCIDMVLSETDRFRIEEGVVLEEDFKKRILLIDNLLADIAEPAKSRIEVIQEKIRKNLIDTLGENAIDENRFAQELIYYLEKLDITEEQVRLKKHLDYFLETLKEPASQGKKLGFIVQEIGREINTIGSKASNVEMQRIVISMKDELEKIKEQLGNIL